MAPKKKVAATQPGASAAQASDQVCLDRELKKGELLIRCSPRPHMKLQMHLKRLRSAQFPKEAKKCPDLQERRKMMYLKL
jgi:hypothetical protein